MQRILKKLKWFYPRRDVTPKKQMAFSFMFMSNSVTRTADVEATLAALNLGSTFKIDRAEVTEGSKAGMSKFFIHYDEFTATKVREELEEFKRRKEAGEMDVRPKRIVYDVTRDGKERYWQIFLCDTPEQRMFKEFQKEFAPRVE